MSDELPPRLDIPPEIAHGLEKLGQLKGRAEDFKVAALMSAAISLKRIADAISHDNAGDIMDGIVAQIRQLEKIAASTDALSRANELDPAAQLAPDKTFTLKWWREKLGITQEKAARTLGYSLRSYQEHERNNIMTNERYFACRYLLDLHRVGEK